MSANGLEPFRRRLDVIDDEIARLLGERFQICREVAVYKSEHEIPMMQPDRVKIVRDRYLTRGTEAGLPLTWFPLGQTASAHDAVESAVTGKVLIRVADDLI